MDGHSAKNEQIEAPKLKIQIVIQTIQGLRQTNAKYRIFSPSNQVLIKENLTNPASKQNISSQ